MGRMALFAVALAVVSVDGIAAPRAADPVDLAIARGLEYLLRAQHEDGSYPESRHGLSTALPSLAAMACLATGHVPGDVRYGQVIDRSLDYVFSHQAADGYLGEAGGGRMYAHAIATLFLTEVSGMVSRERQLQIDGLLPKAIKIILDAQAVRKREFDQGGWRYTPTTCESDTSCSGWCLMALRSARLNGAPVPLSAIQSAVGYMHRHFDKEIGGFGYQRGGKYAITLSGAGILCLELCGRHEDPVSLEASRFIMRNYKLPTQEGLLQREYKYYGMYYSSQGLFQLGGENWKEFSEWMYATFVPMQRADGAWCGKGNEESKAYATSMIILAFAVPYRQLPVFQRDEMVDAD